jgi:glycolate oxidase FAD binding subunit
MATDLSLTLREQVLQACAERSPLNITGGGSKAFYGRPPTGRPLELSGHRGIVEYEPTELVVTARAGTPLAEIEAALAAQGQMLAFEPPHFGASATLGGTVACGLSGPRRPYAGAVRDSVLGVRLLNGQGEILRFGGQVMKNVAGFDVSRLMAGALGTLGVLLEISLRVLPRPEAEETLVFERTAEEALAAMSRTAGQPWPLSAACHDGGRLCLRLSGAEPAIRASRAALGGEALAGGAAFWADLREQRLAFFGQAGPLWRLSVAPASPPPDLPGDCLIDWGGALRWLKTGAEAEAVSAAARQAGGHATRFRGETSGALFQALPEPLKALHLQLKRAFDPQGILNPGRLYEDG